MIIEPIFFALVPFVIALVEVIKRLGVKERMIPFIAILLGVVLSGLGYGFTIPHLFTGIAVGLSAVGLFSGVKNTFAKRQPLPRPE